MLRCVAALLCDLKWSALGIFAGKNILSSIVLKWWMVGHTWNYSHSNKLCTKGICSDRLAIVGFHDQCAGQKCWCQAPSGNGGGQRTRGPEWGLLKPGWGLFLPAATWHRPMLRAPSCRLGPENQNRGGIHPSPNKLHSADKPKASWWCYAVSFLKEKLADWAIKKYWAIKVVSF